MRPAILRQFVHEHPTASFEFTLRGGVKWSGGKVLDVSDAGVLKLGPNNPVMIDTADVVAVQARESPDVS